jgi:hypothetical protein
MYAAYHNHPDVASALIEGECDINAHGSVSYCMVIWWMFRDRPFTFQNFRELLVYGGFFYLEPEFFFTLNKNQIYH